MLYSRPVYLRRSFALHLQPMTPVGHNRNPSLAMKEPFLTPIHATFIVTIPGPLDAMGLMEC